MASASSSSISVPKSTGANSSTCSNRRKSCDTICSSNSSCFLQKKKPVNPLATSVRTYTTRSDVRQRVLSAKLIKLRTLQSQLNDANYHLMELAKENRALKTLQKRQDKALNNYEGVNADLPRLIKSHEEENRMLIEKNRNLKRSMRELNEQLKLKDEELMNVKDQLKHITSLSKDRHLGEREKLKDSLDDAKLLISRYESEISLLNRKMMLEMKNSKQKLNAEVMKHKRCQRELTQALSQVERLGDNKEKSVPRRRFGNNQQSMSLININNNEFQESTDNSLKEDHCSDSSSEIKLDPISSRSDTNDANKIQNTMESPHEKIKARLYVKPNKEIGAHEIINDIMEKLSVEEENLKKTFPSIKVKNKLDTLSKTRDKIKTDTAAKLVETSVIPDNSEEYFTEETELLQNTAKPIDENFDYENIIELDIKPTTEVTEDKQPDFVLKDEDFDLVNKIWDEEYEFKTTLSSKEVVDTSVKNEPKVALENKKKLLAALRDIDNGKSIEGRDKIDNNNVESKKSKLIKELFG